MTAGNGKARETASLNGCGEFRDTRLEALYRRNTLQQDAEHLRHALWMVAGLYCFLITTDFVLLGPQPELLALVAIRSAVALGCLVLASFVKHDPGQTHRILPLNLVCFVAFTGLLLSLSLYGESTALLTSGLVVASLTLYLLVPNRLPWVIAWNAYLLSGFVLLSLTINPVPLDLLADSVLLLGFANLMGWLTQSRINRLQRRQFALLINEREVNRKLQKEIEERQLLEAQLRHMASTDSLTGIANRRHFFELAERELRRAQREGTQLAICMVDIDLFKTLNDHHGHAVGDLVLATVASCCVSMLRETDIIGRYGGEEFIIALPQADIETANLIAERLRQKVASLRLPMLDESQLISVTVGISRVMPGEMKLEPALQRADDALYAGKAHGRNCVIVAQETYASPTAKA